MKTFITIKQLREINDLEQRELCELLFICQSSFSRKENGVRSFNTYEVEKLSDFFKISKEYIIENKIPAFLFCGDFEILDQDNETTVKIIKKE